MKTPERCELLSSFDLTIFTTTSVPNGENDTGCELLSSFDLTIFTTTHNINM